MSDLWSPADLRPSTERHHEPSPGQEASLQNIVERILRRELSGLQDHSPQAQLGVSVDADQATILRAYQERSVRFEPEAFRGSGPATVALAHEISELLRTACEELCARTPAGSGGARRGRSTGPRRDWLSRWFGRASHG